MLVSTKGRYALMIMVYLARHAQDSPVSLKNIAENNDMGMKYLEIIVASLNKAGLLYSSRGKNGGYMLNKKPSEYTLLSILNAAEGDLAPAACVEEGFCNNADNCKTCAMWKELQSMIEQHLSSKTLADII